MSGSGTGLLQRALPMRSLATRLCGSSRLTFCRFVRPSNVTTPALPIAPLRTFTLGALKATQFSQPTSLAKPRVHINQQRSAHSVADSCRLSSNVWAKLEGRGVVRVVGADAITFLQGLTTNDMKQLGPGTKAVSTAFLNAQGRVLMDAILTSKDGENILIDVARDKAADLVSLLKKFKLRAKAKISDESEQLGVWVALGPDVGAWWVEVTGKSDEQASASHIFQDPRHLDLGVRAIAPKATEQVPAFVGNHPDWTQASEAQFEMYRMALGVAQGPEEFTSGKSMPLECNLDMFSGVSFNKGCYVGQELTARTHFRGQVRKRLVPFVLTPPETGKVQGWEVPSPLLEAMAYSGESPAADEAVEKEGKSIGKVVCCRGGVGLAMVRLEHMLGKEDGLSEVEVGGRKGAVLLPLWWSAVQEQADEQRSVQA